MLDFSRLTFGTWLTLGDGVDDRTGLGLLRCAYASGIRSFDLADAYAAGRAEELFGRALDDLPREGLTIASKVFWPDPAVPGSGGLGRTHVHAAIERSLRRLRTDHLDLYYCHREDPDVPLAETVQAMGDLVQSGKVRAWGTSHWQPATLRRAHELAAELGVVGPAVEQAPYSLAERWVEARVVPELRRSGMRLAAYSALAGGLLTGKYLDGVPAGTRGGRAELSGRLHDPRWQASVRRFVAFCRERDRDPAGTALAWVAQQPTVATVVVGASSPAQLEANVRALEAATLSSEDLRALDRWFPAGGGSFLRRAARRLLERFR